MKGEFEKRIRKKCFISLERDIVEHAKALYPNSPIPDDALSVDLVDFLEIFKEARKDFPNPQDFVVKDFMDNREAFEKLTNLISTLRWYKKKWFGTTEDESK